MTFGNYTYRYSTAIFLRVLGGVYLIAFYSLWVQVHGLIGPNGILPAADFFDRVAPVLGPSGWWQLPSILWWFHGDASLSLLCIVGMGASAVMIMGWIPQVCAITLWLLYLSLTVGGQLFFAFPWDNLLLETGLLAILLAPPVWRSRAATDPQPPRIIIFLLHWLLFRLMFSAGYVKLAAQDTSLWDLTALTYHFWTQPLPTWTAWYFHHAPLWFLKGALAVMLFIELIVPIFIFAPRMLRAVAFGLLIMLQIMIAGTGNYGFFNILTMVLCIPLLDDAWFAGTGAPAPASRPRRLRVFLPVLRGILAVFILLVSVAHFATMFKPDIAWPRPVTSIVSALAPFRSVNHYGLFTAMTKSRPEIILEGSRDGRNWMVYEFQYKPGDVHRTPLFVAPHMPRLDWQMWFAAVGNIQGNQWLLNLMARLLEGQPDVLDLLETNPFGHEPPTHLRAVLYYYTFATPEANKRDYLWWNRELKALYCPMMSRKP